MDKLLVSEVFRSIQGEGTRAGLPCAFVRLSGCNLRCRYCDTTYAYEGGKEMTVDEVLELVLGFGLPTVEVTGGEPLLQPACRCLLDQLLAKNYSVLLETNGSIDIAGLDPRVVKIIDLKCPSSGATNCIRWQNLKYIDADDEVKFVVADRQDYDWSKEVIAREKLAERCTVLLSPAYGELDPQLLAEWMIADRLHARLQLQLHKLIWGNEPGR